MTGRKPKRTASPGRAAATWIGGRVPTTLMFEGPEPFRGEAVLWFDAANDKLLAGDIVSPDAPASVLGDSLRMAMAENPGAGPVRVRVASEADVAQVLAVLPGVQIEIGPTPELELLADLLSEQTNEDFDEAPGYLLGGALAATDMARFFELMAELWKAAPWRFFEDTQVLELDAPALGVTGACVSVMGSANPMYGVEVFESYEDFEQFYSLIEDAPDDDAGDDEYEDTEDDEPWDLSVPSVGLVFTRADELHDEMRREVAEHGWVVAGAEAYPLLLTVERDGLLRPATPRDLQLACAVASALAALVREHARELRAGSLSELATGVVLDMPTPIEAAIRFPHTQVPATDAELPPPSDAEVELGRARGERRIEAFLASPAAQAASVTWRENAPSVLGALHDYKLDHLDGRLEGLRPWQLSAFLLDFVPRNVEADRDMVEQAPDVLTAYLAWLGANGDEPARVMARVCAHVAGLCEAFVRKALDPASFSLGKAFVMSARAAGVDLADRAALAAYQAKWNAELPPAGAGADEHARSRLVHAEQVVVRRRLDKPRRWFPLEGEQLPEPQSPCPCGSGRAFRKCCMPR